MGHLLVGRDALTITATEGDGRAYGKATKSPSQGRLSRKYVRGLFRLNKCATEDFNRPIWVINVPSNEELYKLLRQMGYRWDGSNWHRIYPDWVCPKTV